MSTLPLLSQPSTSASSPSITPNPPLQKTDEIKKFACKKCGTSFSQMETFKRHISFYCKPSNGNTVKAEAQFTPVKMASDPNAKNGTPNFADLLAALQQRQNVAAQLKPQQSLLDPLLSSNTVILPVAYHQGTDPGLIQIIGPPQTVIPVAVGRSIPSVCRPLLLDGSLVNSLQLPALGRLPINSHSTGDFNLPLAFIQPWATLPLATNPNLVGTIPSNHLRPFGLNPTSTPNQSATATATVTSLNAISPSLIFAAVNQKASNALSPTPSKRRCESTDKPLDLTTTNGKSDESASSSSETLESETTKKFGCDCGVSFLSNDTLTSHQKYYCRNRVADESNEEELSRKVPSRCSQCDYIPGTLAQLAQHVRHKHCSVHAYVCLICGYKGYSARGIKNHLRCSHSDEIQKRRDSSGSDEKESVLSDKDYVFCVTDKTELTACTKCKSTFPTDYLLKNHNCPAERDENINEN